MMETNVLLLGIVGVQIGEIVATHMFLMNILQNIVLEPGLFLRGHNYE